MGILGRQYFKIEVDILVILVLRLTPGRCEKNINHVIQGFQRGSASQNTLRAGLVFWENPVTWPL